MSTEYINGGATNAILKDMVLNGYKLTPNEQLRMEAHDAMPRNVFYTEEQLKEKMDEIKSKHVCLKCSGLGKIGLAQVSNKATCPDCNGTGKTPSKQ